MKQLKYFLLLLLFASCRQSGMDHYESLVKKELKSNKKVNDIFFGISFGMTSKDFFMHCWDLNKKGIFTDGSNNTAVLYKLNHNELNHPGELNFYPEFHEGKIYRMGARFQYPGWAPWNKNLYSDSLLTDVVNLYKKWYPSGNPFIKISDEKKGTIYVKVDGNRRIIIGRYDDQQVKADYTDLLIERKIKK
jgi:hypothetical protein